MEQIKKHILHLFRDSGLGKYEAQFVQYIKPSFRLESTQARDEDIFVGESKIGGNPDVPADFIWPTWYEYDMSFICQINLSTLNKDVLEYYRIPDKGILSFFYTAHPDAMYGEEHFYFERETAKVYYFNDVQLLTRIDAPSGNHEQCWFKPCKVQHYVEWSVPGPETFEISRGLGIGWNDNKEDHSKYWEVFLEKYKNEYVKKSSPYHQPTHRFLGNHDPVQSGFVDGNIKLLLQIDSDEHAGTEWGDVGRIYFFINDENLKNMNLANAFVIMECT